MFKVPGEYRVESGKLGSSDEYGNNGAFTFMHKGRKFYTIASDGMGWEHVSVSIDKSKCPTWEQMNYVKDLFWSKDDCVIQFHPPESVYVNDHPFVLHLWRKEGKNLELPLMDMV